MMRRPPRSTLFPYPPLFRSPLWAEFSVNGGPYVPVQFVKTALTGLPGRGYSTFANDFPNWVAGVNQIRFRFQITSNVQWLDLEVQLVGGGGPLPTVDNLTSPTATATFPATSTSVPSPMPTNTSVPSATATLVPSATVTI